MAARAHAGHGRSAGLWIMAIIVGLVGLYLAGFGAYLTILGGSIYYVLAGIALIATAVLLIRRRSLALWIYAATLGVTLVWALWEVGLDFWQLAPRGDILTILADPAPAAVGHSARSSREPGRCAAADWPCRSPSSHPRQSPSSRCSSIRMTSRARSPGRGRRRRSIMPPRRATGRPMPAPGRA